MRGIEKSEGLGNNRFGNERESIETKAKKKRREAKGGFLKNVFIKPLLFSGKKCVELSLETESRPPARFLPTTLLQTEELYLPRLAHSRVRGRERYGLLNEFHLRRVWRERGSEGSSTWH